MWDFRCWFSYLFNTEILPFYQELSGPHQIKVFEFTKNKLKEQNEEQKFISLNNSLIPYEVEEEQALSVGYGERYIQKSGKEIVYWNQQVKHDRAIITRGNWMEPDYLYGQIALIKYQNCVDASGGIYAVDEFIRLVSLNENTRIIGKVIVALAPFLLFSKNFVCYIINNNKLIVIYKSYNYSYS